MKAVTAGTFGAGAVFLSISVMAAALAAQGQEPPAQAGAGQPAPGQQGAGQQAAIVHPSPFANVQFRPYIIDDDFPRGAISQTSLFDVDKDGKLDIHIGGTGGNFIYKMISPGR